MLDRQSTTNDTGTIAEKTRTKNACKRQGQIEMEIACQENDKKTPNVFDINRDYDLQQKDYFQR